MTQEKLIKEIRDLCRKLDSNSKDTSQPFERYIAYREGIENEIINVITRYLASRGGVARKEQNPDYSAMGKRGMASRWKK